MHVSFEIVPRDQTALQEQVSFIEKDLPFVDTINVPDLLRLPIRSWEAGARIDKQRYSFIPHFRAIDFNIKETRLQSIVEQYQLDKILLVSGDPPPDMSHRVYDTSVVSLISRIRNDFPEIKIFAGFDPYRWSVKQEKHYIDQKFDAGADFILSQPFFDMRFLQIYSDFLPHEKIYWGVSPVVTEKSQAYWEKMNHAVFPASFEPTYEWNTRFAQQVIEHCRQIGGNLYFMPIRINLEKYFAPLLQDFV